MEIKTAAAYIRVSTDEQTEYSPDAQLRELRDYALSHNYILDDRFVYADEGISGRKAERRPAFMEMIRTAKLPEHPFDVILVHKYDRFARSREDSVVYKSMLKRCGVEVISIKEPLAEGSYSGVMEAIYESFAEAYSINLGQEVKKGMTERARRGQILTAPPYGYLLKDHTYVPHPEEAPYVRELFYRFSSGHGYLSLAKWMNENGQLTHRGGKFENRTVEYILRNPVYIGKIRWNPTGRTRRNYNDSNIIIADGTHEPLIDKDTWDAVQQRVHEMKERRRYHARPSYDRKHWLSGIVRCSTCGGTLIWENPYYFKCNNFVRGQCGTSQHIRVSLLEEAVLDQLRFDANHAVSPDVRIIRSRGDTSARLQLLRQQLSHTEKKKARLLEAYLNGADILDEFNNMKAALNQESENLRAQIAQIESENTAQNVRPLLHDAISKALSTLESPTATIEEKYLSADQIIDTCIFDKATLTLRITYRIFI